MKRLLSISTLALTMSLTSSIHSQTRRSPAVNDSDVELEVQQVLADHAFTGSSIQSSVNQGVVKLFGNVRSEAEKSLAEARIGSLRGVKSVNDLLAITDHSAQSIPRFPLSQQRRFQKPLPFPLARPFLSG